MRKHKCFLVCILFGVLVWSSGAGATSLSAETAGVPSGSASAPTASVPDPRVPGNHAAEQEYLASLRRAPAGVSAAQARLDAINHAATLPALAELPASLDGQRAAGPAPKLQAPNGAWRPLGPAPENSDMDNPCCDYQWGISAGRGTAIAVGQHTGVLYLGAAGGGVWKSTDDGASWTALTDNQPSLSTGALALDPNDVTDHTLYVGTGEANNSADAYRGVGVLKTTNGGQTWTLLGSNVFGPYSATSSTISALAINGTTIYAGTKRGLYRSLDGGASWLPVTVAMGNPTAPVTDVQYGGTNLLVVLSSPFTDTSRTGVYRSTDGNAPTPSFTQSVQFFNGLGRAQLAISASDPNTMYFVVARNDTYALAEIDKSTDGGLTFNPTTAQPANYLGNQGWYDLFIAVDPDDPNLVYSGGTGIVHSTDGGASWSLIADVYCGGASGQCHAPIHPDQHAAAFGRSGSPRPLYVANDGGLYKTLNGDAATPTWTSANGNLNITQFYAGDTTANYLMNPVTVVGAQDNGTIRSTASSVTQWNLIKGSDGAFVGVDKQNPNHVYAEYPNGYFSSTDDATAGTAIMWADRTPTCQSSALFVNPFAMDNGNANHLLYAANGSVCESVNGGTSWVTETIPGATPAHAVAIAPGTSATMYAGTEAGVYRTTNGNTATAATWAVCGTGLPVSLTNFVTALAIPNGASNTVYATLSGFGVGHVWKSVNCGAWTNLANDLPDAPTTALVEYAISGGTALIAGTDIGVFVSINDGGHWSTLQNGLPNVPVFWLYTDRDQTTLFAATHGRGVWIQDIPGDFAVTGIGPASGSVAGGTTVVIRGSGFGPGTTVMFDTTAATNVTLLDSRTITLSAPPHAVGTVTVTVTYGATTLTVPGGYTYGTVAQAPTPTRTVSIKPGTPNAAPTSVHGAVPTVSGVTPNQAPPRR